MIDFSGSFELFALRFEFFEPARAHPTLFGLSDPLRCTQMDAPTQKASDPGGAAPPAKRPRGRPRKNLGATSSTAPSPVDKIKRPRGRPSGFRVATFATLDKLTVEDFSFVRGVFNGMSPKDSFLRFYGNIHFDSKGLPVIPHGLTINTRFSELEGRILSAARDSADALLQRHAQKLAEPMPEGTTDKGERLSLETQFSAWLDREDVQAFEYAENDLPAAFQQYIEDNNIQISTQQSEEVDRATLINEKVKALNELQTILAYRPKSDAETSIWLATTLHKALLKINVHTLGQLVKFISTAGRNWHRHIPRLGPVRGERLLAWLDDHADTLGPVSRATPQWGAYTPLKTRIKPLERLPLVPTLSYSAGSNVAAVPDKQLSQRAGIAPLEMLNVPPDLDGHTGLFRCSAPNHFGARTDMEAIQVWLATFLAAEKQRTFEAYRREVERFYIWCVNEAKVALSSVSASHAMGYQIFLKQIPKSYIGTTLVTREDPRWRPWRGQLTPRSQAYSLTVIKLMFSALCKAGYLSGNPFDSIKSAATLDRDMDTTRALNHGDLLWVKELIERDLGAHQVDSADLDDEDEPPVPDEGAAKGPSPTRLMRARRLRLIFNILLTTGLRLDELARARATDMFATQVGNTGDSEFLLRVVGKGKKVRTVFISNMTHQLMTDHHRDVEQQIIDAEGQSSPRLLAFRIERPLIASLVPSPAGASPSVIKKSQSVAIGSQGLYKTLKTFFRTQANRSIKRVLQQTTLIKGQQKLAGAAADAESFARLGLQLNHLQLDLQMWHRRTMMSTHWLRHTFASEALRTNPSDTGLKLTQQLLGHASITTTAKYVKQDESSKIKAAKLIFPEGI